MRTTPSEVQTASNPWPLACLAIGMLIASLGVSIPNVALPELTRAFAASIHGAQWVVLAYLLAMTVAIVIVGRLGDLLGYRRIFLSGLALFTLSSIACGVAPSLTILIAARAVQGLGAAVLMTLTVAMVRETVGPDRTGRAMGLMGTMSAIGTALGPSLGGVLIELAEWRAIFLVLAPIGAVAMAMALRVLPSSASSSTVPQGRFDWLGTVILTATLVAYLTAVTEGAEKFQDLGLPLLMVALTGLSLFVAVESRSKAPLVALQAFRSRALTGGLIVNLAVGTVMMATLVVGPFYLARAVALSPSEIGFVLSVGPILSALSGVPAGRAVDRFGAGRMLVFGLVQMALATAALALLPGHFGLAGYIAAIALLTPGYQIVQAANNTAVMTDAGSAQRGVFSGLLSLSRNLGLMTGASAMGALFAATSGDTFENGAIIGLRATFGIGAGLILLALAALFAGKAISAWNRRDA